MKRIFALVIICALALCVFVACDKESPTETPTSAPTEAPTSAPTEAPTSAPTEAPTSAPTEAPTSAPTEAPTAAPTEAPTNVPTEQPTESTVDREAVEGALLAADEKLANSLYFTVDGSTITTSDNEDMQENSVEKTIFAGNSYKTETTWADGSFDNYVIVGGFLYNHYGYEGDEVKEKVAYTEEEVLEEIAAMRSMYMYEEGIEMFLTVEVVHNDDGSTTYVLSDLTDEAKDEMIGMISEMMLEITLDEQGRFATMNGITEVSYELLGITIEATSTVTYTYTYYSEGELEITAPEDADAYEEMVEEEWSCDCGASSWEDCICEVEWSCDCGASSWEDCICEVEWSCDCGASSWEDCICDVEWSCDCGAESWEDCVCEYEWSCDCGATSWEDCICE